MTVRSRTTDLSAVICAYLASHGGTAAAGDVLAHAVECGVSAATVHRAADRAGVIKTREGSRTFLWSLPAHAVDSRRDADERRTADHDARTPSANATLRAHAVQLADSAHDIEALTVLDRRWLRERAEALGIDLSEWPPGPQYTDVGLTDEELQALVEDAEYPDDADPTPVTRALHPVPRHRPAHY